MEYIKAAAAAAAATDGNRSKKVVEINLEFTC